MTNLINQGNQQACALTIIRITLGIVFILHGGQKVLGWFGGPGLMGFSQWTATLGVNEFWSYMAAFAEFFGGIMMLLGIATEVGALFTIPVMLGAIFLVHYKHGFFIQNNGYEYVLILIILAIALIIGGPGKYYLWDPFGHLRNQF